MKPKAKHVPSRLGPPPQLTELHRKVPPMMIRQQQHKLQPKMREIFSKQAKMVAKWAHASLTWKRVLLSWMVVLAASKMVLLMLTYKFFTLTALISLQIFHGVWTIAFFCLAVIESRAILPNASCLLAGYLPATTVLHILLIPNDYPLEFIITDAVGTFLAIVTMFMLLRLECSEILHQAEYMSDRHHHSDTTSESGLSSSSGGSIRSSRSNGVEINTPTGRRILGNPSGPTIITVGGGVSAASSAIYSSHHQFDSMLYNSMEEPIDASCGGGGSIHGGGGTAAAALGNAMFDEAVDLEPIDFEHFVEEPEFQRQLSERLSGRERPTRLAKCNNRSFEDEENYYM